MKFKRRSKKPPLPDRVRPLNASGQYNLMTDANVSYPPFHRRRASRAKLIPTVVILIVIILLLVVFL